MGCRAEEIGLRVPGLINFFGEKCLVPAHGNGIHLSTRDQSLWSSALYHSLWELEPCVEGNVSIKCSLSQQGTFRLSQGFDTVSSDDPEAVLGVPEGHMSAMRLVKPMGGQTVGGAAGSTVGLATVWAVVV